MKRMQSVLLLGVAVATLLSCNKSRQESQPTETGARQNSDRVSQHIIPMSKAVEYSRRFIYVRDTVLPAQLKNPAFLQQNFDMPFCETFNREAIDALLAAEGTASVRIYLGVDEQGRMRFVLLPVDDEGNNIITTLTGESARKDLGRGQNIDDSTNHAIENGYRPPPPVGAL